MHATNLKFFIDFSTNLRKAKKTSTDEMYLRTSPELISSVIKIKKIHLWVNYVNFINNLKNFKTPTQQPTKVFELRFHIALV